MEVKYHPFSQAVQVEITVPAVQCYKQFKHTNGYVHEFTEASLGVNKAYPISHFVQALVLPSVVVQCVNGLLTRQLPPEA